MKIKVLLVDDHALFRDGMRYVLQQLADEVEIVDTGNFTEALKLIQATPNFDLALLDLNMPDSDGVPSLQLLHQRYPDIPLVVVSGSDQRDDIENVMNLGAMGFISKMSPSKVMLSALRMVLDGGVYVPPQLLQQAVSKLEMGMSLTDKRSQRASKYGLTPRQLQVLQLIGAGMTNKDISIKLDLAEGTVKIHVAAIYQALHVGTRVDAVATAHRFGFIASEEAAGNEKSKGN
ncbi:MAG: response regulator transcription factor [Sideroxydans sp.]|nr:response regulator transcription factor [Sideroxydans sp.]